MPHPPATARRLATTAPTVRATGTISASGAIRALRQAGAFGACLLLAAAAAAAAPHRIDYLTIDANEGGSAGGHAAIRFGERTFHFQHTRGGLLTLVRDPSPRFEYLYAKLGNRSLRVSRIDVERDTYRVLRRAFDRYYLVQSEQLAAHDAARDDRELLESLLARTRGEATIGPRLRGAGLFEHPVQRDGSAALRTLAARVRATHGDDFIARRRAALRDAARRDAPDADPPAPEGFRREAPPPFHYAFSRRMADRMEALVALEVLASAAPLHPEAFRAPGDDDFALTPGERAALRHSAEALSGDLVDLLASERPDWGFALLLGMARLAALTASADSGSLVFLDRFDEADAGVELARLGSAAAEAALLADARADWLAARKQLADGPLRESHAAALEAAANRYREIRAGLRSGHAVRLFGAAPLPTRDAHRPDLLESALAPERLGHAVAEAAARERAIRARLEDLYAYHLLDHNCVSEIFDTIDVAFGGGAESRAESERRLGGHVATSGTLNFIPFVSERAVRSRYRVGDRFEVPSHRRASVAEMRDAEPPLLVALRESNTVTSTVYRRNDGDSFFLFFTDDNWLARPLFGALNLVAGLGESAVGLLTLPFDRGRTLWLGAKGVVVSLPELAFVNIRKGTHAWVAPAASAPVSAGGDGRASGTPDF